MRLPRPLVTVERGDVVESMSFPGKITLAIEEDLFFGADGRVEQIYVENGDIVEEGALIAELDTHILAMDIELAEKEAGIAEQQVVEAQEVLEEDLEIAQRNLEIAELTLNSLERGVDSDPYSIAIQKFEVDRAHTALDRIERRWTYDLERLTAGVDRAALALIKLEASRNDAQIVAPFSGEVRLFEMLGSGESVRAVQAYETVASVLDPESLQIDANLVNDDLELLAEGMPARITPVSRPGVGLDGEVRRLPQPFGTGTGTLTEIAFADIEEAGKLRPGMSTPITVELDHAQETLWVPVEALHGFDSNYYVEGREGATTREVPVTIGLRNDERVEILSGLNEGDQVVSE
jgi:multidrug efflux pump subunit AcrA (membrane-fusion protein)